VTKHEAVSSVSGVTALHLMDTADKAGKTPPSSTKVKNVCGFGSCYIFCSREVLKQIDDFAFVFTFTVQLSILFFAAVSPVTLNTFI
jgi:hypothetical protein